MNYWIDGKIPVVAEAAVVFSKDVLTSLTIHHVYDYTVAYAGTKTGKLIKVCEKNLVIIQWQSLALYKYYIFGG